MAERFKGSPPVRMKIGGFRSATSRINFSASSVVSSSGWRFDCAQARQWQQARSHACVVSQITTRGQRLRSKLVFIAPILEKSSYQQLHESHTRTLLSPGM